jgi:hypothetical protein
MISTRRRHKRIMKSVKNRERVSQEERELKLIAVSVDYLELRKKKLK